MQLNVNDKVNVRLTDFGREWLSKWLLTWSKPGEVDVDKWFPQMSDGSTEFTLWELMQIFGTTLHHGCEKPFDPWIDVIVEPPTVKQPTVKQPTPFTRSLI